MIKTVIEWHELAKGDLPKKSGEYLCVTENGQITELEYSKKYNAFNGYDDFGEEFAKANAINVDFWAKIPKELKMVIKRVCC